MLLQLPKTVLLFSREERPIVLLAKLAQIFIHPEVTRSSRFSLNPTQLTPEAFYLEESLTYVILLVLRKFKKMSRWGKTILMS